MWQKKGKNKQPGLDISWCINEYQKQRQAKSTAGTKAQNICLRLSQSKEIFVLILLCCLITSLYL